eukprot:GFYU01011499.1.p1 GENE.GFYU01011499.1~~GFYU01011499.1.p1  ORF type:complete len:399 (-),score=97.44 GFYU01011499.1:7-1203(-)
MGVAEIIIEVLMVLELIPKIPFRLDFLTLTLVSTVLAFQTLKGVLSRSVEVTRDALQVAMIIEIGLILGDTLFAAYQSDDYPAIIAYRVPFMILTASNVCLIAVVYSKMVLAEKTEIILERHDFVGAGFTSSSCSSASESSDEYSSPTEHSPEIVMALAKKQLQSISLEHSVNDDHSEAGDPHDLEANHHIYVEDDVTAEAEPPRTWSSWFVRLCGIPQHTVSPTEGAVVGHQQHQQYHHRQDHREHLSKHIHFLNADDPDSDDEDHPNRHPHKHGHHHRHHHRHHHHHHGHHHRDHHHGHHRGHHHHHHGHHHSHHRHHPTIDEEQVAEPQTHPGRRHRPSRSRSHSHSRSHGRSRSRDSSITRGSFSVRVANPHHDNEQPQNPQPTDAAPDRSTNE